MRQAGGDASPLRRLNPAAILRIPREGEVVTLAELARAACGSATSRWRSARYGRPWTTSTGTLFAATS
ncbi:hypothetical protein ACWDOR_40915 [Streptosporangium canum]|uniref:hypothetical protein n=1 Tax=Streptosporangium canum TaxID=324952 RepID=UPI0036BDF182